MVGFLNKDKMNRILNYKDILLLYSCLRQIDLSIDRSRWSTWGDFQHYFQTNDCLRYIKDFRNNKYKSVVFNETTFSFDKSPISKIKSRFRVLIFGNYKMSENEASALCTLLHKIDIVLNDIPPNNNSLGILRVNISCFYAGVLEHLLSNKDFEKASNVEHFFQNETLNTLSISNIINQ